MIMSDSNVIKLEGSDTPDILLNDEETVLMDVSQGVRDLGLVGLIFKHKGRLVTTNQRAIYFKKKTKDYEIQQLNMHHAGYVKMGYNIDAKQFVFGLMLLLGSFGIFPETIILGLIMLVAGLLVMYTARVQGLILSGSGEKITFASKSIPASELAKIITIVSANS